MNDSWANAYYYSANSAWESLYFGLCDEGDISYPRGKKVKETLACNIYILNPMNNIVHSKFRGLSPVYMAKEYMWYKSGSRNPDDAPNSKFWKSIANKDDGLVNSNYGAYIFVKGDNGLSVWDETVNILKDDPDSRKAIIQIPIVKYRNKEYGDTPCTSSIQFLLRDNRLFAVVYMRSCDVCCGFPYDVFQFTMWQIEMAKELGVELGHFRFVVGSIHVYEEDFIENRKDDIGNFRFNDIPYYGTEDKGTDEFKEDLKLLSYGRIDGVRSKELISLYNNKRIWKRNEW